VSDPESVSHERRSVVSVAALASALAFGLLALAVVVAGLTIPIAGTNIVTDPREVFTTLGAAVSGPVGGLIIGLLAGIREPDGMAWPSVLAHVTGCVFLGWAYKTLVWRRMRMPALLLGWVCLVLAYYYLLVLPGFVLGSRFLQPDVFAAAHDPGTSVFGAYAILARGVTYEVLVTCVLTVLVIVAVPRRHRRPVW